MSLTKLLSLWSAIRQRQHVIGGDVVLENSKVLVRLRARTRQYWEVSGEIGKTGLVASCAELACKVLEDFSPALVGIVLLEDSPPSLKAAALFRRWISREPSNAYAHFMLASAIDDEWTSGTEEHQKARLQDEELKEIDAALRIRPQMVEALFAKAYFLERRGVPDQAEVAYRKMLKQQPKFAQALLYFGSFLVKQDRKEEAIACLNKARVLVRGARPLTNLAHAYLSAGENNIAIELFQKALDIDPTLETAKEGLNRAILGVELFGMLRGRKLLIL